MRQTKKLMEEMPFIGNSPYVSSIYYSEPHIDKSRGASQASLNYTHTHTPSYAS